MPPLPAWFGNDPLPGAILAVGHSSDEARRIARGLFLSRVCAIQGCGRCAPCRALASGANPDWIEVGDEERGAAELRLLLARLALAPTGPFRLVLLPEATSLSPAASAALLKGMEEPPPATTFFLQAENPLRVLPTIRSRSFRFSLPDSAEEESKTAAAVAAYARDGRDWTAVTATLGRATGREAKERLLAAVRPARVVAGADPASLPRLADFAEALAREVSPKLARHLLGPARSPEPAR